MEGWVEMNTDDKFDFILRVAKNKGIQEDMIYEALITRFKELVKISRKASNDEDGKRLIKQYWAKCVNELYNVIMNERDI